jgi:hypothetical protein
MVVVHMFRCLFCTTLVLFLLKAHQHNKNWNGPESQLSPNHGAVALFAGCGACQLI